MYENILNIANHTIVILTIISVFLLLYKIIYNLYALAPIRQFNNTDKQHKYAILIPARNESSVIENLLKSIKNLDYDADKIHTYVIIESKQDKTYEICKKYKNTTVFIRPNLDVKSKGGALDQAVKHILEQDKTENFGYAAYFIFDADNTIQPNFITEMNKTYCQGYDIAMSYRNSSNWNDSWVSSCSGLTFSMINSLQNKCRSRVNKSVLVSGTGFYISSKVINKLQGWPFQSLTEDVEISNYCVLNNIKGAYNENTQYFDEQPIKFKTSWNQRIRWVKGHNDVSKKYTKKLLKSSIGQKGGRIAKLEFGFNLVPLIVPITSILGYSIFMFWFAIAGMIIDVSPALWQGAMYSFLICIFSVYSFFMIHTIFMLFIERKKVNLTTFNTLKTIIMNPIFLFSYLPIYLVAITKKEITWTPIDRKQK